MGLLFDCGIVSTSTTIAKPVADQIIIYDENDESDQIGA